MSLLRHFFVFIFLLSFIPNAFSDVAGNDSCGSEEIISSMNNVVIDKTETVTGSLTNGTDKQDYYKFTVGANGALDINISSDDDAFNFYVGSACAGTDYYNGSTNAILHSTGGFNVLSGTTVYIIIDENAGFNYEMNIGFTLGSNAPIAVDDIAETNTTEPIEIDMLNNDYDLDGTIVASTLVITNAPTKGTLSAPDPVTGVVTYTPTSLDAAGDSFTYTVRDNSNIVSNEATVTISFPIPIAYDKVYTVIPSGEVLGNVITDIITDPNYADHNHTVTFVNTAGIVDGTLIITVPGDGDFNYTAPNFVTSESFTYKVTNSFGLTSNEGTVTFYVNEYCANAITLLSTDTNCSTTETNATSGSVTEDGAQYYKFELAEDGLLDINLTNTDGNMILYYDFTTDSDTCPLLFAKGTTSQLDSGYPTKNASILLDAGTYYLGLQGTSNIHSTDYNVSVAFRSACAGDDPLTPYVAENIGINEVYMDYDTDKNITTKIVDKLFDLQASYLDASGSVTTYDGSYGTNKIIDMTVIAAHADGDTCTDDKILGQAILPHLSESTILSNLQITEAYQNRRVKITAFDYAALMEDASGLNCANSSLESGLCLVPACFNNVQNIRSVFPPAFQPGVMLCIYGDGTGGQAPCDSDAYYGNCGGTKGGISPSTYNVDLGCAMCLADAMAGNLCSRDEFAIRPEAFDSDMTLNQKFKAGELTSLTFNANKFGGVGTPQYDEAENTSFVVDVNISDSTKSCQEMSINFNPSVNFDEGTVTDNYALNNVGDFNVTMHEVSGAEYALVDADDTNDTDRLITPYTQQIKVVPHHFGIDGNFTNGSNSKLFTYLNNFENNATLDQNISALMDWNVIAQTQTNATTTNYTTTCYAKDGNITLTPTLTQAIADLNQSLSLMLWYDDENNTIIGANLIEGPYILPNYAKERFESGDSNGTGNFKYRLNFDRNVSKVVNPFRMTISDLKVTDTDLVDGNNTLSNNATYLYGRTHASRQRYQGDTGTANIYFEAYCFGTTCDKTLLNGFSPNLKRTDDIRWFYNEASHNTSVDGSVGVVQQKDATPLNAADDLVDVTAQRNNLNPSEADLDYDESRGYPYKTTMHNNADHWLIYNKDDPTATRNEFQVEFLDASGWSGEHETDTTTKDVGNIRTNRRSTW